MSDESRCSCPESLALRAELARQTDEAQSYARSLLVEKERRARLEAALADDSAEMLAGYLDMTAPLPRALHVVACRQILAAIRAKAGVP